MYVYNALRQAYVILYTLRYGHGIFDIPRWAWCCVCGGSPWCGLAPVLVRSSALVLSVWRATRRVGSVRSLPAFRWSSWKSSLKVSCFAPPNCCVTYAGVNCWCMDLWSWRALRHRQYTWRRSARRNVLLRFLWSCTRTLLRIAECCLLNIRRLTAFVFSGISLE